MVLAALMARSEPVRAGDRRVAQSGRPVVPNGAGKTTLLEMIIGLLEPTEGEVSVFGVTSRAHVAARLARVGYVAQDYPLYRDFSVADMFHLGRAMNPAGIRGWRRRGWTRSASR